MKIVFSTRVRELRTETGLTQQQLAKELGVTQRKVSYWEMGKIEPDLETLWKLSDFFGVTVDFLIGKSEY